MILYQYVFGREPGILGFLNKKTHSDEYYVFRDTARVRLERSPRKVYTLTTPEGLKLKGYYYPAGDTPSDTIAFIIHGYRSNHGETAGPFRELYHSRGIDIFAVDNPAAGTSEGELVGYDYTESEAAFLWLEFLLMEFGENIKIILHGFSMGGGAVLSMSDRVPQNVRFIVDDCGFSGAPEILRPRTGKLAYTILNIENAFKQGFGLGKTDCRPHLANAKCPVLFVHGEQDPTVPFEMGQSLYRCCSSYKEHLWIENAKHMECIYYAPGDYSVKIDKFLKYFC